MKKKGQDISLRNLRPPAEDQIHERQRLPGAVKLVYDDFNALVIGFGPSERASEAIFSLAIYPNWA